MVPRPTGQLRVVLDDAEVIGFGYRGDPFFLLRFEAPSQNETNQNGKEQEISRDIGRY